jgi:uncharacterized OsmC-like protein
MAATDISAAMTRFQTVLRRRPEVGLHEDAPATAHWSGDTRIAASHANGTQILTDMPTELGGSGDRVSPGWLFRAGFASCAATLIAMVAAERAIELDSLDVLVSSRSDTRGLLGMADPDGTPVYAGPGDLQTLVRISAHGVSAAQLHDLVHAACRRSPVACALQGAVPMALRIEVNPD